MSMRIWHSVGVTLAAALGLSVTALSQTLPPVTSTGRGPGRAVEVKPTVPAALAGQAAGGQAAARQALDPRVLVTPALQPGVPSETAAPEPEQRPEDGGEEEKWGPTMPEDVKLIMDNTAFGRMLECRGW